MRVYRTRGVLKPLQFYEQPVYITYLSISPLPLNGVGQNYTKQSTSTSSHRMSLFYKIFPFLSISHQSYRFVPFYYLTFHDFSNYLIPCLPWSPPSPDVIYHCFPCSSYISCLFHSLYEPHEHTIFLV